MSRSLEFPIRFHCAQAVPHPIERHDNDVIVELFIEPAQLAKEAAGSGRLRALDALASRWAVSRCLHYITANAINSNVLYTTLNEIVRCR